VGRGPAGPADRVIARGVEFIVNSARPDGSWPIDTNLSIWVTTLSINALAAGEDAGPRKDRDEVLTWLKRQQLTEQHPYTGAAPGAWGWSDLPGSVPDADDTPGALLALFHLDPIGGYSAPGLRWLLDLQNTNGGWPTFCRGWGKLPFDRSGTDLTAHAIRALGKWMFLVDHNDDVAKKRPEMTGPRPRRNEEPKPPLLESAILRGFIYLTHHQRPDGSWLPLWFGNQYAADDINPVYGTARVLAAYRDLSRTDTDQAHRGVAFLLDVQNPDGGWGGAKNTPSSVEETALAVEILLDLAPPEARPAVERGVEYLVRRVEDGTFTEPSPIGFYFAKLWYFEKLYPIVFTVAALGRAVRPVA
jgi:squalene-hopene/tetraprenyl-beta-curcumene cyclase